MFLLESFLERVRENLFSKKGFPAFLFKKSNQLIGFQAQSSLLRLTVEGAQDETSVAAHRDGNGWREDGIDAFLGLEVDLDETAPHSALCRLSREVAKGCNYAIKTGGCNGVANGTVLLSIGKGFVDDALLATNGIGAHLCQLPNQEIGKRARTKKNGAVFILNGDVSNSIPFDAKPQDRSEIIAVRKIAKAATLDEKRDNGIL